MKKNLFLSLIILGTVLFLIGQPELTNVSAQSNGGKADNLQKNNPNLRPAQRDKQLADLIEQFTKRSDDNLKIERFSDGEVKLDILEGYKNVMLARTGFDGEPLAACVTSLGEANSFFGRNLETGESVPQTLFRNDGAQSQAALHGMSPEEFKFYQNLIEWAQTHRAASPEAATVTITNNDAAGEGFNDPAARTPEGGNTGTTLGQQRLNLFNFAAGIWGAFLDSSVTTNVGANFDSLAPCTTSGGVLGSAGPNGASANFTNAPMTNTYYPRPLVNKLRGVDSNGASPEISTTFNSDVDAACLGAGTRFYYGFNNSTPPGTINLLVVLLHELGHGFGFVSFVNSSTGALPNGIPDIYTRFMFDTTINKYWSEMTNAERNTSKINSGNVFWDGANVKIASGFLTSGRDPATGRVLLYTPTTLQPGSSISHFDVSAFPNLLMEPAINNGLPLTLDLTRQQMRDIGWYRDTTNDLVPDTVTNVTPNSGTVTATSTVNINWTNTGGFANNVTIELSTDGGTTFPTKIAENVANTGSYTWTVPSTTTTQARIRVREFDFVAPSGVSSANFAIVAAPTAASVAISGRIFNFSREGIADAVVSLINSSGEVQTTRTNSFGYYRFAEVAAGETYTVTVRHRRYQFQPQILNVLEDIELNLAGR